MPNPNRVKHVASVAAYGPNGHLLFGKRNWGGKFTMPGGTIHYGEHPTKAAVRELYEETGLKPTELEELGSEEITIPNGQRLHVHSFKARVAGEPTSANNPDNEIHSWHWVDVSQGLPSSVSGSLHNPNNPTLRALGLQPALTKGEGLGLHTDDDEEWPEIDVDIPGWCDGHQRIEEED